MHTFVIDSENNVTVFGPEEVINAAEGPEKFNSLEQLADLAGGWPTGRLVEIWNSLPGVVPVRKFTNRSVGVSRVWKALQQLSPSVAAQSPTVASPEASGGRRPGAKRKAASTAKARHAGRPKAEAAAREGSKKATVLALLRRPAGATLSELMKATGWQPHSVRGFLSGAVGKKMGLSLESAKREDGERFYRLST